MSPETDRYTTTLARLYPEMAAGGFTRADGTVEFYQRVNALVGPESVVLNLGAGRGKFAEDPVGFRRSLQDLRPRAGRVIGVDVDPAVRTNPGLDEAHAIGVSDRYPVDDASVDLVLSDWTFEHIANPGHAAREIDRVLRPGGWVCARTPNKWGPLGILARAVPNGLHDRVLRVAQPSKQSRDTFPTTYRLNTPHDLRTHFPPDRFDHFSYTFHAEPSYLAGSPVLMRAARATQRTSPAGLRRFLMIFLRKRPAIGCGHAG